MALLNGNSNSPLTNQHVTNGTPLKLGSISKKLLTPCRRVGLCRKVIKTTPTAESTPVRTLSSPVTTSLNVSLESSCTPHKEIPKKSKQQRIKKCLKLDKENCDVIKSSETGHEQCTSILELNSDVYNQNLDKHMLYDDTSSISKNKSSKKLFTKGLSMKRKSSSDDLSDLDDKHLSTPTNFIDEDIIATNSKCNENSDIKLIVNKSSKRKIIYSSDEDDFVDSQNLTLQKIDNEDLRDKISHIKQNIKTKKANLEKLQQAAIYQKLHNIDQLKDLTNTWRKGCHEALQDLLHKLQNHGPINMQTLLLNLKIPKEIVDYNTNTDGLI